MNSEVPVDCCRGSKMFTDSELEVSGVRGDEGRTDSKLGVSDFRGDEGQADSGTWASDDEDLPVLSACKIASQRSNSVLTPNLLS